MLDSFVAITPLAPFIPAVKAIGIPEIRPYRNETLQTIAAAKLEITKQAMEDAAVNRLQAYREALSSWDGSGEEPVL
jgi:hypothetical protein